MSDNRTLFPQLCPQEFLRLEHVRDPIKFDDLDLRLFTAGELNIIDRHDIPLVEKRGRTDLLKNILYLAGYYEWRGILQFYATIINQIELGIKGWESGVGCCSLLKLEYYSSENLLNYISSFCDNFTFQKSMIIVNFCFLVKLM